MLEQIAQGDALAIGVRPPRDPPSHWVVEPQPAGADLSGHNRRRANHLGERGEVVDRIEADRDSRRGVGVGALGERGQRAARAAHFHNGAWKDARGDRTRQHLARARQGRGHVRPPQPASARSPTS